MKLETIFEKKILEIKLNFKNKLAAAIIAVTIWSGKISEERNGPATEIEKESWKSENKYFIESSANSVLQSKNWQNSLGYLISRLCPESYSNFPNLDAHYQQVLKVNSNREITPLICNQILAKMKYQQIQKSVENDKSKEKNLFLLGEIIKRISIEIAKKNQREALKKFEEMKNQNRSLITHNKN